MSNNKDYLVITAVGPDRPGIVSELSALIHRAGANLEDSRMAVLGGEFALLVLASGNSAMLDRVQSDCEREASLGLKLLFKRTTGPRAPRSVLPYAIHVSGFDRPGIVQAVTGILARRGVNVTSLETRLAFAPHSGTPLFVLEADLEVPSELALSELRRELGTASEDENLDLTLKSRG